MIQNQEQYQRLGLTITVRQALTGKLRIAGLFLAGSFFFCPSGLAQDSTANVFAANPQTWFEFYLVYPQSDKLDFYGDASYRHRYLKGADFGRYTLRPSVRYKFKNWVWLGGGAMGLFTVNEKEDNQLEARLWQGINFKWSFFNWPRHKPAKFGFFLRAEQRWFFNTNTWNRSFSSRTRLQFNFQLPLVFKEPKVSKYFYLTALLEPFISFSNLDDEGFLQDAARTSTGIGYVFSYSWKGAFEFVWQRSRNDQGTIRTSDYLLRFKITWNFLPFQETSPEDN